ncbi:Smr/MutS family protein [Dysgonomonas mossii]|uniref:Endonuclease MutS2 n=1 Tax=Dysgonomonas mossii TaxID=163665 RepID=A0A4Y9IMZ3_9BACT|nr:Smr/MutS family protein [Dysgonomonas mossii]MBF0760968.1 Smr/MutS family protein [Dysgonomonas mossii]TFU89927.1 endonuclease MutS2 [Dysgonomonas mossii]
MIYPENFEYKIGFDKIRQLLIAKCLSPLGEEKVTNLAFSSDYIHISESLSQTEEFMRIINEEDNFPTNYFLDVRHALRNIRVEGTWIDEAALFDLRRSLQTIRDIVLFLKKEEEENTPYPYLYALAGEVAIFPQLISKIDNILDKFGRIKDNASAELSRIRKDIAHVSSGISRSLNAILRTAQNEGLVEKDVTPTMRDGRLVIPVAPAFKRKIKGIVHDESASGKTVFIEPAEVVEANNRIRELESEERREIIKILVTFTDILRPLVADILQSYEFLATIDFIRAKATFAIDLDAIKPSIEDKQIIRWYRAKHPLLFISHRKQNKQIVPLDIELEEDNRILIISGPNAGGKSVCLKTVGLLQYMVQCGIPIPLAENSKVGIFNNIFIDIGDEQSIENDLSTYSSHLTNMKFFVRNCDEKTILLIDEFGGGTEPQIGGAIAESLLKRFNEKESFGVITTHYQNLKHYANEHKGVINGAMLYDRHLMQPLFTLSIGNPGSSFAIEIARKIGLPEDVIADASEIVGSDYINMDKYLQDIVRDKRYWETKRQSIRQKEKRLEEITTTYETDLLSVEKQRKEILRQAKADAERVLSDANAKIENTIRTIRESQAEKEKTKQARLTLNEFKSSLENEKNFSDDKISKKIEKLKEKEKNNKKKSEQPKEIKEQIIAIGDNVRIKGQTSIGQVLDIQKGSATVAFGMIKSTVKLETLEYISKNQVKRENRSTTISVAASDDLREKKLNFKQDIDVRGMRGEEALQAVMYFVDDAVLVGVSRIRILHGTGTGALRQMIRDYLRTAQGVRNFQDEHVQFGGTGITVVDLE